MNLCVYGGVTNIQSVASFNPSHVGRSWNSNAEITARPQKAPGIANWEAS